MKDFSWKSNVRDRLGRNNPKWLSQRHLKELFDGQEIGSVSTVTAKSKNRENKLHIENIFKNITMQ